MLLGGKTFSITNFSYIVDNPIFIHQLQLPKGSRVQQYELYIYVLNYYCIRVFQKGCNF